MEFLSLHSVFMKSFTIFTCKSAAFLLSTAEYSAEGMPDGQTDRHMHRHVIV